VLFRYVRPDPAERERARATCRHLDRHLVVGAADAARAGLEHRRHGLDRLLPHLPGARPRALCGNRERVVDDLLRGALLPLGHDAVDQLADEPGVVHRVRRQLAWLNLGSAWHYEPLLAPYFERPGRR